MDILTTIFIGIFLTLFTIVGSMIVKLGFMFNTKLNQLCSNQMLTRAILTTFDGPLVERMWPNPKTFSRFNYKKLKDNLPPPKDKE